MELLEQVTAVAAVLALLAGTLWWLRRGGGSVRTFTGAAGQPAHPPLYQLARLSLTPQHSLHLVRLAGRALLIARSPVGLTVLESVDWPDAAPPESLQ